VQGGLEGSRGRDLGFRQLGREELAEKKKKTTGSVVERKKKASVVGRCPHWLQCMRRSVHTK
jgi:hypothetical protein